MPAGALGRGGGSSSTAPGRAAPKSMRRAIVVVARPPSILHPRGSGPGRLRPAAPRAAGGIVQLDPSLNVRPRISIEELDDDDAAFLAGSGASVDGAGTGSEDDVSGARDVASPLRPLKINQDLLIVSFL